jgi:hypothetical protein
MSHEKAADKNMVESYVRKDLPPEQEVQFEAHYFECPECAETVALEQSLPVSRPQPWWRRRAFPVLTPATAVLLALRPWSTAPALAALALAGVTAYQALVVIPALRGQLRDTLLPQPVASYVMPPISRGDARALKIPEGVRFYTIYMDPTWEGSFAAYLCSVQDESGSTRFSIRLPGPPPGKPVQILMARSLLPSGRYTVVIRNAAETSNPEAELARYALVLKLD